MVLVDDVNDIIDPLDTVDMDAEIPAIKLELDDNIESDEEFCMKESEWCEANGSDEWVKRSETPSVNTTQSICENTFHDDNSESLHFDHYENEDIQTEPEGQKPILPQTDIESKESIEYNEDIEVKPVIKKVRVHLPVSRSTPISIKIDFSPLNHRKRMWRR